MKENFNVVAAALHLREAASLLTMVDFKTSTFLLQLAKAVLGDAEVGEDEVSEALSALEQIDPPKKDTADAE